jgi:hypothetical protein
MDTLSLEHPRSRAALRRTRQLTGVYLAVSVLAYVAIILLRNDAAAVNPAVWVRGTIVLLAAVLLNWFAAGTANGNARAYLRLRIVSAITVVAIAAIIAVPGTFPLWLKLEQGLCGVVMLGVVVLTNGKHLRSVFAARR